MIEIMAYFPSALANPHMLQTKSILGGVQVLSAKSSISAYAAFGVASAWTITGA
jgi:hypothetical protein